jgi:hypothetical protein
MELPDPVTERLREANQRIQRAQERLTQARQAYSEQVLSIMETNGIDPEEAQVDLQDGVIREPDPKTDGDQNES